MATFDDLYLPTIQQSLANALRVVEWHHLAFSYSAAQHQIRHYVDGKLQLLPPKATIQSAPSRRSSTFRESILIISPR